MNPRPRHSKCGRSSKTSAITSSAFWLPSYGTTRVYWFSTSQRPSASCTRIMWIAWRMSSGSKPAMTHGLPYCAGMNSNGRAPTTVETWPGPMKPSRRRSGDSSSARSGGTIVTWLHITEKLRTPSAFARMSVSAVEGAVVSKPIAKKTVSRSGFALAMRSASSGE